MEVEEKKMKIIISVLFSRDVSNKSFFGQNYGFVLGTTSIVRNAPSTTRTTRAGGVAAVLPRPANQLPVTNVNGPYVIQNVTPRSTTPDERVQSDNVATAPAPVAVTNAVQNRQAFAAAPVADAPSVPELVISDIAPSAPPSFVDDV